MLSCLRILMLICFSNASYAQSSNNYLDTTIKNLIIEKLGQDALIELRYNSHNKAEQISNRQADIESVSLLQFDPRYSHFMAKIHYHDGTSEDIHGMYTIFNEVPVLSRLIKAGEIITDHDIMTVRAKTSGTRSNFVVSSTDIVGMQARKDLPANVMIKISDLVRPAVIKPNDPVNLVYNSKGISLKTSGISLGTGAIGDMIKVRNEDTGVVLLGQIINKNTVTVGGE